MTIPKIKYIISLIEKDAHFVDLELKFLTSSFIKSYSNSKTKS